LHPSKLVEQRRADFIVTLPFTYYREYLIMANRTCERTIGKTGRYGFSLLELTITTMILGVVAAITIPKYTSSLHRYRMQMAIQRLAQDIELCRRTARSTSQEVTFKIYYFKNCYGIPQLESPLRPGVRYEVALGTGGSTPRIHPINLTLVANQITVSGGKILSGGDIVAEIISESKILSVGELKAESVKAVLVEDSLVEIEETAISGELVIVFDRYGVPNQAADIGISCGSYSGVVRVSAEGIVTKS
jgi:prepilin-type N-terminal cleavage/methylation domain-containing protein